jgi:Ni/Co efflux regulator RcnB
MNGPMRRLSALAAALALVAGPLAAGGQAWAKDHHEGGGRGEQRGGGEGRGANGRWGGGSPPGWRGGEAPPGYGRGGEGPPGWRGDPRGDPRYEGRGYGGRGYEGRGYEGRGYERGYPAPPPQAYAPPPRRGGYLGPQGGAPIEDPGRYRLREAPRGYVWMRVPGGMAMVSQATGQIFDIVPDR